MTEAVVVQDLVRPYAQDLVRPYAAPEIAESQAPESPTRIQSIDFLRGLIMIVMALDHTRDYFHHGSYVADPTDLATTYPAFFLTRWVTHYCAPLFFFLAGVGAALQRLRGRTPEELSRYLFTRGLLLMALEVTLVRYFARFSFFGPDGSFTLNTQVIWTLGVSMIVLAACVRLRSLRVVAVGAALMIGLHNLLDGIQVAPWGGPGTAAPDLSGKLWIVLHQFGRFPLWSDSVRMVVQYPLIPWCAVMAAGYVAGQVYGWEAGRRRRALRLAGLAAVALFIVIRTINVYGDPSPWSTQKNALFTVFSFVNVSKYPPSLLYVLMTVGPGLVALAALEGYLNRRGSERFANMIITVGRVPLYFYLLQWLVPNLLFRISSTIANKPWRVLQPSDAESIGFSLPATYAAWMAALIIIYPMCVWYARLKARHPEWRWLSYL